MKTNIKLRVTPEQSKVVQEICFAIQKAPWRAWLLGVVTHNLQEKVSLVASSSQITRRIRIALDLNMPRTNGSIHNIPRLNHQIDIAALIRGIFLYVENFLNVPLPSSIGISVRRQQFASNRIRTEVGPDKTRSHRIRLVIHFFTSPFLQKSISDL